MDWHDTLLTCWRWSGEAGKWTLARHELTRVGGHTRATEAFAESAPEVAVTSWSLAEGVVLREAWPPDGAPYLCDVGESGYGNTRYKLTDLVNGVEMANVVVGEVVQRLLRSLCAEVSRRMEKKRVQPQPKRRV